MNFRHCLRLAVLVIFAVAGEASATGPVWHVSSLRAKVIVNSDASLSVDETLIIPENADPNFGLRCEIPIGDDDRWDREFGPGYTEDNGLRLKIQRVAVDGAPAEYRLDHSLHHFHQVIVGRGNRWTSFGPGAHELNVVYQVTGAVRAVGGNDELYWNVAGHSLPIAYDSVSARVYLPDGAGGDSLQISSYEGGRGVTAARMRSGVAIKNAKLRDGAEFSVGDVGPHESLTIVLRWPQGFVHRPTTQEKYFSAFYFSPVILLLFYIASRLYLRRDVAPYSTAPQYEPPQGLSPAALRYVMRGSVDGTSVAASLASLAVQGYVQVETKGASYRFRRTQKCDSGLDKLPAEQKAIAELMFDPNANVADAACGTRNDFHDAAGLARQVASDQKWADSVTFGPSDPRVNVLVGTIYSRVKPQLDGKYFTWNAGIVFFGMLATLIFGVAVVVSKAEETGSLFLALWSFGFFQMFSAIMGLTLLGRQRKPLLMAAVALVFSVVTFMVARQLARDIAWGPVAAYLAMIVVNGMFLPLLRTPTAEGQKLLTQIQGYKAFLEETERDRLTALGKTAGFQSGLASLPYSIALDLKEPWGDAMANTFTVAMTAM